MIFLGALESMLSIAILVGIGFFIAYLKWVSSETEIFLPKLITKIVLPPYLMSNIVNYFDRNQLLHMIASSLVPICSMIICFFLLRILAKILNISPYHRGLFAVIGTVSNTILIGIPVNIALFGESSLPYVLLYFFANTLFFWIWGCSVIASEGQNQSKHNILTHLKQIFSPPLCGVLLGLSLVCLNLSLPKVILTTCGYLGQLATPLALIFVGITLQHINWKETPWGKDLLAGLVSRLVLAPAVLLILLKIIPLPQNMAQVFIIQSSLPCMAVISVMSAYYGADKEYASTMIALTTVVGMITVPIWMSVIHQISL